MKSVFTLLLLTAIAAAGEKKIKPAPEIFSLPDQVMRTPDGTISFRQLTVRKCTQYFMAEDYLQGEIVNDTTHTWERLAIDPRATGRNGSEHPIGFIYLRDFRPGQTARLGDGCGLSLLTLPRDLVSWGFFFSSGKIRTQYELALVRPSLSTALQFEDASFLVEFHLSQTAIEFAIRNKLEVVARIDWSQAAFVDWTGLSHPVMHQGVKFADKASAMPPTVIPPGARVEDGIIPSDNVSMGSKSWITEDLLPSGAAAATLIGKTFTVYLPILVDGKTVDYSFTFKISSIQY